MKKVNINVLPIFYAYDSTSKDKKPRTKLNTRDYALDTTYEWNERDGVNYWKVGVCKDTLQEFKKRIPTKGEIDFLVIKEYRSVQKN